MKKLKLIALIMAITLMCSAITGCSVQSPSGSSADSGSETPSSQAVIKIGVFDMPSLYLMETFNDMGYYEKNGANVQFTYFPVYSDAISAFNTGNVDMICYAAAEGVAPVVNGIDCKIIGVVDRSDGLDGIAAKSDITSVEQLKGKTIATEIGTVDHMMLQKVLEKYDLSEKDVSIVNMAAGDAVAALQGGSIDAVSTWEPQLSMAAQNGNLIYSTKEDPSLIQDIFLIHSEVLDAQYDNAEAILKTWYECAALYQENPDQFAQSAAEKGSLSVDDFKKLMDVTDLVSLQDNKTAFTKGTDDDQYLNVLLRNVGDFLYEGQLIDQKLSDEEIANMLDSSIINDLLSK